MKQHPLDVFVGSRLRQRRNIIGLSQRALGKKLGITSQQVQKYEKGANRISVSGLYEIANILDTTPLYFIEGFDKVTDRKNIIDDIFGDGECSKDAISMVRCFTEIKNPTTKKQILSLVKSISEGDS